LEWIPFGLLDAVSPLSAVHTQKSWVFFPFLAPAMVGNNRIISVEYIGYQPVLDFTVNETHCYESGGVISHNTGKSFGIGGYETTLHLTGDYPSWWIGRRFNSPTEIWVAGDTTETTRDIIQQILLGNPGEMGTGLIPQKCILGNPTHRAGVAGAVDSVRIKHKSGGTSTLGFKCFAAGTEIKMADDSVIPIEEVALGQEVACVEDRIGQVSATHSYYNTPLIKISTRLGWITVTPNHEMFTDRGKVEAGSLTLDDSLETAGVRKLGRVFEKIIDISTEPHDNSYCITVEPYHELIAGGYRVGNSYDQGRKKFQGTAKNCIWLDEQPPVDVYTECLTRLMTKDGSMICTFTPLEGLSDVVLMYLPEMAPNVGGIPGMGEDWEE
jgi:phage terminase large subunit-like protein